MRDFRVVVFVAAWIGLFWGSAQGVFAQDAASQPETVDERIDALDRKVRDLEKQLESQQEGVVTKSKETPAVHAGNDGFSLVSADGDFRLKL